MANFFMRKYRYYKLMFNYVLLLNGNQAPMFFWGLFFFLVGGLFHYFLNIYVHYLFYFLGCYNLGSGIWDYLYYIVLKPKNEKMPPTYENLGWLEIMKKRYSVRAFQRKPLLPRHEEALTKWIKEENNIDGVEFVYVKKQFTLVFIADALQNIVLTIPKRYNDKQIVDAGRSLFRIFLKMTKMGINGCVVGGFTNSQVIPHLPKFVKKRDEIAIVMPIGYESKHVHYYARQTNKFCRTRKPFTKLFFDNTYGNPLSIETLGEKWKNVVEASRWAPSASNMQNTRIVRIGNKFHFYKQGVTNKLYDVYTRLNMGISMTAWEYGCEEESIKGEFKQDDPKIELPGKHVKYYYTYEVYN